MQVSVITYAIERAPGMKEIEFQNEGSCGGCVTAVTVVTARTGERVTNERDADHSVGESANCKSIATEKHERPQKIARPNPNTH